MKIQQIYTSCLAQAAYYIESNGEAAIIDPLRDIDQYLQILKERNAKLKFIFETHFHADFVSGHLDLARQTGATIVFGPDAIPGYTAYVSKNHEFLPLGKCSIEVLHTPGHTIESSCFLFYDEDKNPHALFSGDTVFVGDVGRPDLLSGNLPKEELASMLYDSIQKEILPLRDDIILYPGHGAGSPCGRNLGKETYSTLGTQKKFNYALQKMSREEFIKAVTSDQPLPPKYFFSDAVINKTGYDSINDILKKEIRKVSVAEISEEIRSGTTILDVRTPEEFAKFHIEESINIGLDGTYAIWAGTLLPVTTRMILISPPGKAEEAITRLSRVGFENIIGYWDESLDEMFGVVIDFNQITCIEPENLKSVLEKNSGEIIDVRNVSEFRDAHIKGSHNLPLNTIMENYASLKTDKNYYIVCAGGYRSMIACSILASKGFVNLTNVNGGMARVKETAKDLVTHPEHVL
jgi:hydroxyacylglutathione hydrolase